MAISDRIRKLRSEKHWSQAELGEQLGVQQKQVSAYERGVNLAKEILDLVILRRRFQELTSPKAAMG